MANVYLEELALEQGGENPYLAAPKPEAQNPYLAEAQEASAPSLKQQLIEGLKDQGKGLVQFAKYMLEGPGIAFGESGWLQINKPSIQRDYEKAQAGDPEAAERARLGRVGTALVASTAAAGIASRALGVGQKSVPLAKRAVRFTKAEALGGGVYGAIDPGDRDRTEAIVQDAITFPIAGGILNGVFKGLKGGYGFIGSKFLSRETKEKLATLAEPEAKKVANDAYSFMQRLGLDEDASNAEIAHAQALAIEQALAPPTPGPVSIADIAPRISTQESLFPAVTPEHRAAMKEAFGSDYKIYEATYNAMRKSDDAVKYEKQKSLLQAFEDRLTAEQRTKLRAFGKPVWEVEIEQALKEGNQEAAASIAIEAAVDETPIKAIATPELQMEADKLKTILETVTAPAFRSKDGRVFKGAVHVLAHEEARAAGVTLAGGKDGFVTSTGRFVTREEATNIAEGAAQISKAKAVAIRNRDVATGFDALDIPTNERARIEAAEIVSPTQTTLAQARKNLAEFEAMPRTKARRYESQLNETQQIVMQALAANDTDRLATKLAMDGRLRESSLADIGPAQIDAPRVPTAATDAAVLYNRADDITREAIEKQGESIAMKFLQEETGAVSVDFAKRLGARVALGTGSAYAEAQTGDDRSGFQNTSLHAVAGVLGLAAVLPGPNTKALLQKMNWSRNIIKLFDLREVATREGNEGMQLFHSITGESRAKAVLAANKLREVVKGHEANRAFTYVVDEGAAAPEYALLTPEQQKEALSLRVARRTIGQVLESQGLVKDWVESYYRNILPKETFQAWNTQHKTYLHSGTPQQVADFERMRTILAWAKQNNLPEPIVNAAEANATHLLEAGALTAIAQTKKYFIDQGLLRDVPPTGILHPKWRRMTGDALQGKMAPDDVATVLERMYSHSFSVPGADALRGMMMKSIMIFPWEHGINLARGVAATDFAFSIGRKEVPFARTMRAMKAIDNADPVVVEASKYTQLFKQPDLLNEASERLVKNLRKYKLDVIIPLHEKGDRALWERWAPAVGIVAWTTQMRKWGERTGFKFMRGSPEYEAAARAAGKFADDAMGKIPDLVQSPKLAAGMRMLLFSPAWLRTRMSILGHAAGDLQHIMAGELNPKDAQYLQYKMKSVALGIAFTYTLSKAMSGEDPEYNPNTTKVYAKSGIFDDRGREIGVDLVGWWQDDLKLFNDPWTFLENRLNPLLRTTAQTVSGRDVFGNELDGMERWENLVEQLGPPTVPITAAIKTMQGEMTGAEGIRSASEFLAVGNVSALPHYRDVAIAEISEKILRMNGLSVHRDNIYELSKYIRQNISMSGSWYGDNIQSYIAYKTRSAKHNFPITSVWRKGKEIIRDTFDR